MTAPAVLTPSSVRGHRDHLIRRLLRDPLAIASIVILLAFIITAVAGQLFEPFPPNGQDFKLTNVPAFSSHYLLGGDNYGRDILSRVIASAAGSLQGAVVLPVVAAVLGITSGLLAGYFESVFEAVSTWVFGVITAAPAVVVLIGIYTVVGASPLVAMAALGVLLSPSFFWPVRSLTRGVRSELYVDAARVSGLSDARILVRHVLVAIRGPIVIIASFLAGAAVSVQAGLQFLGLGKTDEPSWGGMISDAFNNFYIAPTQLLWPALALGLVIAAFVLLGNSVRDALVGSKVHTSKRERRREVTALFGPIPTRTTDDMRSVATQSVSVPRLLTVDGLQIVYSVDRKLTTVVEGISLHVDAGEIVGLVGESGSGKTQTVFATLGLLPDEAIVVRGSIQLSGREVLRRPEREIRALRGTEIAYVPQEPVPNLDPSFRVGSQLVYGIRAQTGMPRKEAKELALSTLARVGIRDPENTFRLYPHEISGGMAQRVLIAGAVAVKPRLLIADEPTTALDVTVQAEVLDLLRDLQRETGMGVLIVTHNFGVIADLCDRVVVMRTGKIVEEGPVRSVFSRPQHEYTKTLLASILDESELRAPVALSGRDV